MSETVYPTQSNFQSESTASGKEFEDLVNEDLLSRGYTILGNNVKIPEIGINVDYIAEKDGVVEYGEDKGGKSGNKKRPGTTNGQCEESHLQRCFVENKISKCKLCYLFFSKG